MKILAIRGTNLASLPEFNIDFAAEPLNRSGLFAITGKTGAGKSTILDALCIALFDKTPRLAGGGAMVGRPDEKDDYRVNAGDVRSLVRQGTAGGSAEVDFVGRDGRRYRASWQARRARSRADGKFQPQTVSLLNIDTKQPLGGTKTETLALIQEKIGLSYEQFRRSVLLAQGEFAAFLKADGKDRAELLEKITGTDIYARLSIATFSRKRSEEQALELLLKELGGIILLNDEERSIAQAGLNKLDETLRQSKERLAEMVRFEAWYGRHDQLHEGVTVAEQSLVTAREAHDALLPLRERLKLVESAERFRTLVAAADRTGESVTATTARRDELLLAVAAAQSVLKTKQESAIETAKAVEIATKQMEDAQPLIIKARELDTRLLEGQRQMELRKGELSIALNESEAAKHSFEVIEAELAAVNLVLFNAEKWLEGHNWAAPVVTEWERWQTELLRYAASQGRISEITRQLAEGIKASEDADTSVQTAREALATSGELFVQASTAADAAEKAATGVDLADIRLRIDSEQARLTNSGTLLRIVKDAVQTLTDKNAADSRAKALCEAIRENDASLEADRTNLPAAIAKRDEAEHSLNLARATMDLADHRATLQKGDPCPLCGSQEHPYLSGKEPAGKLITSLESRFNKLRDSVSSIENRYATTVVKWETCEKDLKREQQASSVCAEKIEKLKGEWLKLIAIFPADSLSADPTDEAALNDCSLIQETAAITLAALRSEEHAADKLLKAVAPARTALDKFRNDRDTNLDSLKKTEETARETARLVSSLSGECVKEEQTLAILSTLLEIPFKEWEGWRKKVTENCVAFISEVEEIKLLWTEWIKQRVTSLAARDDAASRAKEAAARSELFVKASDEKKSVMDDQERGVEALLKERSKQFDGTPADEIERTLTASLSSAREQASIAKEETSEADKKMTSSVGKLGEVENQLKSLLAEQVVAMEELGIELSVSDIPENEVRKLLSVAADWRKESRDKLEKADVEMRDAGTRLDERKDTLEQHLKSDVPAITKDMLASKKEDEATQGRELEDNAFGIRHTLTADAENRKSAENLLPKIEVQRGITNLWQGMSDLIGSADGKKFRVFAQSLTLDLLLAMANEHLESLSPRFSLMRIPSSEMELQVIDRDMGDDIRGVNSISGGESFLVSLALALGLSTLASGTTRIGSLFIDEGFGSLDPDTLDTALSTLDALQATGRMVGVISHLPGLTEKIGTRIEVTSTGGGKSSVMVYGV